MPTGGPTGVNKTFPQGRHENLKTGYSIGQRNNTWMIKQWKLCFRRPMKMEVCESTLHEVHYTFWNSEENWREEESFHRKEEETFSCRWFQQNRQDLRSLHELPTRSWQAFLGGRGRTRKKRGRKGWETTKRRSGVFPQTDAGTQQVKSLLSHRFAPFRIFWV